MSESPEARLKSLLASMLKSWELRDLVDRLPRGEEISRDLPELASSQRQLIDACFEALLKHDSINADLFDALRAARPPRREEINRLQADWPNLAPRHAPRPRRSSWSPRSTSVHVERPEVSAALAQALLAAPPSPIVLLGMAGVGKTHMAEWFAAQNAAEFPGGVERLLLADDERRVASELLAELVDRLDLGVPPAQHAVAVEAALLARRCLLLVENVDGPGQADAAAGLAHLLPQAWVLATGRCMDLGSGAGSRWRRVIVKQWDPERALQQLEGDLGGVGINKAHAKELVHELGFMPLAIRLAAGYLRRGRSPAVYLELLRAQRLALPAADAEDRGPEEESQRRSIASTFHISLRLFEAQASALGRALCALGLAPLVGFGAGLGAAVAGVQGVDFELLTWNAESLSLLEPVASAGGRWRVHKLLGEVLRLELSEEEMVAATERLDGWFNERLPKEPVETRGARWGELRAEGEGLAEWLMGLPGERALAPGLRGLDYAMGNGPYGAWLHLVGVALRSHPDPKNQSALLWRQGQLALWAGDLALALRAALDKAALDKAQGWDRGAALAAGLRADVLQARGELDEALRIRREESLPVYEQLGDIRERAVTLGQIADILKARGQLDEALRIRREEELPVHEQLGDIRSRAVTLGKIADILQARGQLDEALRIRSEEELPVHEQLGGIRSRALTLGKIADILQARGQLDEALRIRREEELPVYEQLGDIRSRAVTMGQIADILQARGQLDEALRIRREEELPAYEQLGDIRSRAVGLRKIAGILQTRGQLDEALRLQREEVLPVYIRLGLRRDLLVGQAHLALTLLQTGLPQHRAEALTLLTSALHSAIELALPEADKIRSIFHRLGIDPPA